MKFSNLELDINSQIGRFRYQMAGFPTKFDVNIVHTTCMTKLGTQSQEIVRVELRDRDGCFHAAYYTPSDYSCSAEILELDIKAHLSGKQGIHPVVR